jgi:protein phosphatase 1L
MLPSSAAAPADPTLQASDGLWAYVSDQQAVDYVHEVLEDALARGTGLRAAAKSAAQRLAHLAQACGSGDDVSVIVNAYEWPVGVDV